MKHIAFLLAAFSLAINSLAQVSSKTKTEKIGDVLELELISTDSLNYLKKTQPKFCSSKDEFPKLAPQGYVYDGIICESDFDNNGLTDYLLFIRATKHENFESDFYYIGDERHDTLIDRNPRGYLLVMNCGERFEVTSFNYECFPSANESGGVYYPPEFEISPINVDNETGMNVSYYYGTYGNWGYSFKYKDGDFILTKYNSNDSEMLIAEYTRIININFESGEIEITKLKNENEYKVYNENYEKGIDDGYFELIYETKKDTINYESKIKMSQMMNVYTNF